MAHFDGTSWHIEGDDTLKVYLARDPLARLCVAVRRVSNLLRPGRGLSVHDVSFTATGQAYDAVTKRRLKTIVNGVEH